MGYYDNFLNPITLAPITLIHIILNLMVMPADVYTVNIGVMRANDKGLNGF